MYRIIRKLIKNTTLLRPTTHKRHSVAQIHIHQKTSWTKVCLAFFFVSCRYVWLIRSEILCYSQTANHDYLYYIIFTKKKHVFKRFHKSHKVKTLVTDIFRWIFFLNLDRNPYFRQTRPDQHNPEAGQCNSWPQ